MPIGIGTGAAIAGIAAGGASVAGGVLAHKGQSKALATTQAADERANAQYLEERNRKWAQEEEDRKQAAIDRQKAEEDRQRTIAQTAEDRAKADIDRQHAEENRQLTLVEKKQKDDARSRLVSLIPTGNTPLTAPPTTFRPQMVPTMDAPMFRPQA